MFAIALALTASGVDIAPLQQVVDPAQEAPPPLAWPETAPERVTQTPDWSDYRLYPAAAQRKGQEGAVTAQVLVDTGGKPVQCRVVRSSGHVELDEGNCALMMTMRFAPARNGSGSPIPSVFQRRIGWILASERRFASSSIDIDLRRDAGGRPLCRIADATGPYTALWSSLACSVMGDTGYFLRAASAGDTDFRIAVRLDAGDGDSIAQTQWPAGDPLAVEQVTFSIGANGDPTGCRAIVSRGFGPRGLNNLSPCGRFVSALWLKKARDRTGKVETRVYRADPAVERPKAPAQ